jgi:hypothetical protein
MFKQRVMPRALIVMLALGAGIALARQPPVNDSTRVASATPPPQSVVQSRLGVYVFPKNGQSTDKQRSDELHCYDWAKGQTGYDPIAAPPAGQPAQAATTAPQNTPATGATRGAAVGAIGGAIGGNAGKGAAIGAGVGAIRGARQRNAEEQQQAAQQQVASQAQAQHQEAMAGFRKAFSACLDGSGYTVR